MSVTSIDLNLKEKLKNEDYKFAFFETKLADEVAHNLRTIREAENLRQSDLAEKSGMKQTAISRLERSEEANWNNRTLFRLALALDHRLKIIFQPIDEAIQEMWPDEADASSNSPERPWEAHGRTADPSDQKFAEETLRKRGLLDYRYDPLQEINPQSDREAKGGTYLNR
jgi:transcriptional regulator with XRE-family HTH domain